MKRLSACLIFLAMLWTWMSCAAEAPLSLDLPKGLKVIDESAFDGTSSARKVVLSEGAERIESRAFASSGVREAHIPASVSYIAEDAFDGCENLVVYAPRNSYAHEWLAFSDYDYQLIEAEEAAVYAVSGVGLTEEAGEGGAEIRYMGAYVTASENCTLALRVLDEDESVLYTASVQVSAPAQEEEWKAALDFVLPAHYILEAVLVDEAGNALCDPCRNLKYTQGYAQFEAKTMEDYPKERVLDFGSSGFGVLADGVIPLGAEATEGDGGYTFRTETALKRGDIVLLDVDDVDVIIKIASIRQNGDGTVTAAADPDIYLAEMYDAVKISADVQGVPMQLAKSSGAKSGGDGKLIDVKHSVGFGPMEVTAELAADIHIDFKYDKNILKDYEMNITLDTEGELEVMLGASIDTAKEALLTGEPEPAIQLYNRMVILPGIHAPAFLNACIPLQVVADAGGSAEIAFENHHQIAISGENGYSHKKQGDSTAKAEIKGEFELMTGLEGSLTVSLFGVVNARVAVNLGPKLTGKEYGPTYGGSTKDDSIHGCTDCLDLDLYGVVNLRGTLVYKITKALSGSLLDVNIAACEDKWADAYLSLSSDEDSLYGGRMSYGLGDCKNFKHRVIAKAINRFGMDAPGTPIAIEKTSSIVQIEPGVSPYKLYLYNGHYGASADFGKGVFAEQYFEVKDAPVDVNLAEPAITVSGRVTDYTTGLPIAGASVSLLPSNGMEEMCITDENGCYTAEMLPAGECLFSVEADGYVRVEDIKRTLSADQFNRFDFDLYPKDVRTYERPYIFLESWMEDEPIEMGGKTYEDAVAFTMGYEGHVDRSYKAEVSYNLKGKYSTMSFDVGFVSGKKKNVKMTITADGRKLYDEEVIYYSDAPRRITLPVTGVRQLVIHFDGTGYDKARYAIGDVALTGNLALAEKARVSDSNFAYYIIEKYGATVKEDTFYMGGYNYLGGCILAPGYNGTADQSAYVVFEPKKGSTMLSFDIVRYPGASSEESVRKGLLTIEVDGSALPGYNETEMLWNDLPREISVGTYGASEVKIKVKSDGSSKVQWGIGNIQMQ